MDQKLQQKTLLIAPLDWGLGHAARCVPIISELQKYGVNIIIAADGPVKTMLKQEFPGLIFIHLPGYRVKYSKRKGWLPLNIFFQLPKIAGSVIREHRWLKAAVKKYAVDAVISDNRFGLYHSTVPSVYITHQLFIKTGSSFSEVLANKLHSWFIKKYTQCWVPDFEGAVNVGGILSHPQKLPVNVRYIGCLSRFEKQTTVEKDIDLLITLSGPEPQRSIFENNLLPQLKDYKGRVLFVRGLPGTEKLPQLQGNIVLKNHLPAEELSKAIQASQLVLGRSGYTSIMDLLKLDQKAVLVPTPGQAEQEYLAFYLSRQQIFYTAPQDGFLLKEAIRKANDFSYQIPRFDMELYKKAIRQFVETL